MPGLERATLMAVFGAIEGSAGKVSAETIVLEFLGALINGGGAVPSEFSPAVDLFRSAFVDSAHRFASADGAAELIERMMPAVRDQLGKGHDSQPTAMACTAWMLLAIASDDGRSGSMQQLFEGAVDALVSSAPQTREITIEIGNEPGSMLLNELSDALGIDQWSEPIDGGTRWYPGALAVDFTQHIVGAAGDGSLHEVSLSVPIVRGVQQSPEVLRMISELNEGAGGDALVLRPDGVVAAEFGVVVHAGSFAAVSQVTKLMAMAMVDLAESRAELLAHVLHGEVARAAHPALGTRATPDELLGIIGSPDWPAQPLPSGEDFWRFCLEVLASFPGSHGSVGATGLSIELPAVASPSGATTQSRTETVLLTIGTEDVIGGHDDSARARLGPGVTFRCGLPWDVDDAHRAANDLNLQRPASRPQRLGAWYGRDRTLWLTMHLPSAALPAADRDQATVITNLAMSMIVRAKSAVPRG